MINPFKFRSRRRHGQRRRGATAIEFAVVAPTFVFVMAVCAEFSRMCIMRNASQNACYEAARFAMGEGATIEDGIERANAILGRLGNVQADITINGSDGTGNEELADAETVQVQIVIPLNENAMILPSSMFGENTIGSQITLRTERYRGFFDSTNLN